jgi:SAM-dependent methyltransferase
MPDMHVDRPHDWTPSEVVDVAGPNLVVRTYIEQEDVRRHLRAVSERRPLHAVADVGAGYGRMSLVLREFSNVVAFERNEAFVRQGQFLQPNVDFRGIQSLSALPAAAGEFDFAMTFTVLQHLSDADATAALGEIRRVTHPDGFVLLCEESDVGFTEGDPASGAGYFTIGRDAEFYARRMAPFRLLERSSRRIEPGYPRPNVGDYLLFGPPGQAADN